MRCRATSRPSRGTARARNGTRRTLFLACLLQRKCALGGRSITAVAPRQRPIMGGQFVVAAFRGGTIVVAPVALGMIDEAAAPGADGLGAARSTGLCRLCRRRVRLAAED